MEPVDYDIEPSKDLLRLMWSDGRATMHSMADLRRQCPCASCRAEREKMKNPMGLRVLSGPAPAVEQAVILKVHPVGRYALRFDWNDRHSTGIYSYEFLLEHSSQ